MQNTLSIRLKYRPIKIGWCARSGNFQDFEEAIRCSPTCWGGRYNPIIPIDDFNLASKLIYTFRVDALYPVSPDAGIREFVDRFPHLPWPLFHNEIFIGSTVEDKRNVLLDVQHPLRFIYEERQKKLPILRSAPSLFQWDDDDPLSKVFLATFGGYPSQEKTGHKYEYIFEKYLRPVKLMLNQQGLVPNDLDERFFPNTLTEVLLRRDSKPYSEQEGFYYGDVNDFEDVVNFWNLRASDIDVFFYDPSHSSRLDGFRERYSKTILERPGRLGSGPKWLNVWGKNHEVLEDISPFQTNAMRCAVGAYDGDGGIWNGLNVKPPVMYFDSQSSLATVSENQNSPQVSFELPDKPFFPDNKLSQQHTIVSIWPVTDLSMGGDWTLQVPNIPELNEYLGRECHFVWNEARAEEEGLGIVIGIDQDIITLRALRCRELISKIFEVFGMSSTPSPAGLICNRLIQQLHGLQGCRVFKIGGVRTLIEKYGPDQTFTRSGAIQTIREENALTKEVAFSKFEGLFIEPRETRKLTPEDALKYLVKNGVFRIGLELECRGCELTFWKHLDDIKTVLSCDYCGNEFNITPQLRDRDWAYRRSGLFGRDDNQAGSIPVIITLQQMDTFTHMHPTVYATSLELEPKDASIEKCETDFVLVTKSNKSRVQIVIGECKTRKEITEEDVLKLTKVANTFPQDRIEVYILFSKLSGFSDQEIERCKKAQDPYRNRVILLTDRELEPYSIYERTKKEFSIAEYPISLDDLANSTLSIFFNPVRISPT